MSRVNRICLSAALTALVFVLPYPAHAATCKIDPKLCDGLETSSQGEFQSPAATQESNTLLPSVNQVLVNPDDFVFVPQVQSARACSPLRWNEDRIIEVSQSPTDPGDYGASGGVVDPIGIIQPPPDAGEVALADGLVLDAVDAGSVVSTILNPPYALANARLIGGLPGNLIFDYYDGRVAIFTPCRNGMPTRLTHPISLPTTRFLRRTCSFDCQDEITTALQPNP